MPAVPASGHWWRSHAACASAPLWLVDQAFDRPGSASGHEFRTSYCADCPVREQCLAEAMRTGEAGIWGGTSPIMRTGAGSPTYMKARPDPERIADEAQEVIA